MNPLLTRLGAAGGAYATQMAAALPTTRTTPAAMPAGAVVHQLADAYDRRVEQIGSGRKPTGIDLRQNTPQPGVVNRLDAAINHANDYSSISDTAAGNMRIRINPNADRSYLAHELGHAAARHTDAGQLIHKLRSNPKLTAALLGAAALTTGTAAALTPGDDDLAGSIGLASALYAPTLVDEALASKNALAILENANLRATPMQRTRLAGGLLSYAATPVFIGALSTGVGNQFDSDPVQTSSTLMP